MHITLLGLQQVATTTIATTSYATQFGYTWRGDQQLITNPDSSQVKYFFNAGGLIDAVQEKEKGGSFADVVDSVTYAPNSLPAQIWYANGATTTNTYNSYHLYRLVDKVTTTPQLVVTTAAATSSIAFDTEVLPGCNDTQGTSCTWSHTVSGSNTLLVVSFQSADPASGTGCTWNGTAMTSLGSVQLLSGFELYGFYTLGASGTHNIVCSQSNANSVIFVSSASYNGVAQTGNPDETGTNASQGVASFAENATSTIDNDWGIWAAADTANGYSAGANTTLRTPNTGSATNAGILDTGGVIYPAGSVTLNVSDSGSTNWGGVIGTFAPGTTATTTSYNQVQDLAYSYDALGDILSITDGSNSGTAKTVNYAYDGLGRLTSASTTGATTTPDYKYTYAYDPLGNITSGPVGVYTYAGNTGSSYANPDAVTSTGGYNSSATSSIAFDTEVLPGCNDTQGTSCTWSHTVSGSNTLLVVSFQSADPASGTGCTWNGTAMTSLGSVQLLSGFELYGFYTLGASGTHNIVCSQSNANSVIFVSSASYNGVAQTGNPDETGTNASQGVASFAENATSTIDNDWGIWAAADTANGYSAGANTTLRTPNTGSATNAGILDTGGVIHPAGSVTLNVSDSGSTNWGGVIGTFAPAGATTTYSGPLTTFAYDDNGNLISSGSSSGTSTYVYDYKNELTAVGNGHATSTYAYDYLGNRITTTNASGTETVYPTPFYSAIIGGAATTTKQITFNNTPVATIEDTASSSVTKYVLTDHLGSPTVLLNASSSIAETLDYYPYGGIKFDTTTGGFDGDSRKFIDQVSDATGLDYLNARYYEFNARTVPLRRPYFP